MPEPSPDELTGRSLDAAIARYVFGYETEQRTNARTREPDYVYRKPGQDWVRCAFYGSLSASLTLELRLRELGWTVKDSPFGRRPDPSGVVRVVLVNGAREVQGTGHSLEEALCRGALNAVAEA